MQLKRVHLMGFLGGIIMLSLCGHSMAQEKGWVNLFDGKTLTGWKVMAGKAKYEVADGAIVGTSVPNSGNTFLVTEKEYGNLVFEVDIKIEDTSSNSGIQVRSHFDPAANNGKGKVFGRQCEADPSFRKWTGGIYDEGRRGWLYPLDLNADAKSVFKVGEYNHFTVECIGDEMKTWVNGKACAYLVDTIDSKGFIGLQVHAVKNESLAGKKIYFKNIRIKTGKLSPMDFDKGIYVADLVPNRLTDYEKKSGWKLLFDGKTNKGWQSMNGNFFPKKGWEVKEGVITVFSSEGKESQNGGDIVTDEQFSTFDLSFDFKMTPGANSGVKYFVTLKDDSKMSAIGLEYQILDDSLHPDAKAGRNGNRTMASLYDLITANKPKRFIRPMGAWNTGRVVVYPDNRVEHYFNGVKVLEYVRGSKEYRGLVAISKYHVWPNFGEAPEGHILLQDHGNEVSFKNIKIRSLK